MSSNTPERPIRPPFELSLDELELIKDEAHGYTEAHPYHTLDEARDLGWSLYDDTTNLTLSVCAIISHNPSASTLRLSVPDHLLGIQNLVGRRLQDITMEEIRQHDEDRNPQPPEELSAALRRLYLRTVGFLGNREMIDPETALRYGIPELIDYEQVWEYARSDREKEETIEGWKELHRLALHILTLLSYRDDNTELI